MPKLVAFLRAINVGGRVVKMDALRAHCERCGLANVETFIASGNVIFDSRAAPASLEQKIEPRLRSSLGYEVDTFVRTLPELAAVVRVAAAKRGGAKHAYVGFLRALPPVDHQKKIAALGSSGERFFFSGREIYWFTSGGVADSKFSYTAVERATKSPATFRNITTVTKLVEKYAAR